MLGSHCRAIRCEHHDWPFVADNGTGIYMYLKFSDTKSCESIRSDTICWAWARYDHDWSIEGDTNSHDLVSRSDTITYVWTGLHESSLRWGVNLMRT